MPKNENWFFIDENGTFRLSSPCSTSHLYFPLVNQAGLMSSISPILHGDIKVGQHSFLTRPVSVEDLHESRAARNFWVDINGYLPWSATGCSAEQTASRYQNDGMDDAILEAGMLWHRVTRRHAACGLTAAITSFVPQTIDQVELTKITLTNPGPDPLNISATFAVPIFGRSADQLRDHRHVTSLLNQIEVLPEGVRVKPTLLFDETGHHPNHRYYMALGVDQDGNLPSEIFPLVDHFIGEGGSLDWPEAVIKRLTSPYQPGQVLKGYEALGGLRFPEVTLAAGESTSCIIVLGTWDSSGAGIEWIKKYGKVGQFDRYFEQNQHYWKDQLDRVRIQTADKRLDGWSRWVSLQPILRQLYGNSFLPYHDYGRGGRGWRDLWQDILGLLLMQTDDVSEMLESNFAGVRFDGSNATIIGHEPGDFKADRNNILRVWMDHGAWPLLTVRMYLDWTGNHNFLLNKQPYFKDHLTHRCQKLDPNWASEHGTELRTRQGNVYQGTIFEHLLIQNLVPFFNVGEHNCIKLEGADWNDALDMGSERGESVAFTAFYAGNLASLADLADLLAHNGNTEIHLAEELILLLDTLSDQVDYDDPATKQDWLVSFLDSSQEHVSGNQIPVALSSLAADLRRKAGWMKKHLQKQEWLDYGEYGWFNGYYDNQGARIEGIFNDTVQMTLAGQVFQLMFGIATEQQAMEITESVRRYLYDPAVHGVRLNTDFKYHTKSLGRIFGFAYGHKENGAMFSHMAVMYAYALYQRKFYSLANQLMDDLYQHCQDFSTCRIYPGIPEYLDPSGRGRYPYLTGSASWYMLTLITQIFGIRGLKGNLFIRPAINPTWFDEQGIASIHAPFAGRKLRFVIHNPSLLPPEKLVVQRIEFNGEVLPSTTEDGGLLIQRREIQSIPDSGWKQFDIYLKENRE
jgi:cellobiose phosphorylase